MLVTKREENHNGFPETVIIFDFKDFPFIPTIAEEVMFSSMVSDYLKAEENFMISNIANLANTIEITFQSNGDMPADDSCDDPEICSGCIRGPILRALSHVTHSCICNAHRQELDYPKIQSLAMGFEQAVSEQQYNYL